LATPFLQHLGEAGWSRDGVDAVVCTHLHVDHVGWNTMFENGKWALVEQDHVISPEIRLMPSTGHTPGHVSVMIESEGERAVITGDMIHHPCQLAHPDWSLGDNDPKAAALTRSRLFAQWAEQTILVIGTHLVAPTAGHIVRDGAAFRFAV
jgi:glyoxylase-like metal-dependent hydrolase (beta-lactamase superfamily II)